LIGLRIYLSKMKKLPLASILLIILIALIYNVTALHAEEGRFSDAADNSVFSGAPSAGTEDFMDAPAPETAEKDLDDVGLMSLARSLAEKGDTGAAVEAYKVLLDRFPTSSLRLRVYYEIGLLKYGTGDIKGAKSYLERVLFSWGADPVLKNKTRSLVREIDSIYKRGRRGKETVAIGALVPVKRR